MNANKKNSKPARSTPPVLKKLLLCLLFISALGGYAGGAYMFSASGKTILSALKETLQPADPEQTASGDPSLLDSLFPNRPQELGNNALQNVRDLFRNAGGKDAKLVQLTFQGMLTGTDGAIAMINGKQVAVGTELEGVNVLAISNRVLILEYKEQTRKLGVGETVSVQLD